MTVDPRDDLVAQQYQKWTYPEPIHNLETWFAENWQWFDPSHSHRMLWPDRPLPADLDILVAGCGTNQAAQIAYTNRAAKIVAVDVSQPSLDHEQYLKDKYGLSNLELRLLPIEEIPSLGKDFDLVVCSGVLHHMDSPEAGMQALADIMRPDAVAMIMLYARYGRFGVESMQAVFREMGLKQDEESLQMVKAAVATLGPHHPLQAYISISPDLNFDAGMVDTFLHGRDKSFTVDGCIELVEQAGLVFQDWYQKSPYYPSTRSGTPFDWAVNRLPNQQMWSVMERINSINACHLFLATRPERPVPSYRIDFTAANALSFIPLFRLRAGLNGDVVYRHDWSSTLTPTQSALVRNINGELSIREIIAAADVAGPISGDQAASERFALELFESLWRFDFIAIDLSRANA